MPEIYYNADADISDYSEAGSAVNATDSVASWLKLPQLTSISPGQVTDFVVALDAPKGAKRPADKFGFQVGVASQTDAKLRPAIGIWWLVSMR